MYRHPFTQAFPYVVPGHVDGSKVSLDNFGLIQLQPVQDQRLPAAARRCASSACRQELRRRILLPPVPAVEVPRRRRRRSEIARLAVREPSGCLRNLGIASASPEAA